MEIKRALVWYLVIVVVMAVGVYLALELFINKADVTPSELAGDVETAPETPAAEAGLPPFRSSAAASEAAGNQPISREDIPVAVQADTGSATVTAPSAPAPTPAAAPAAGGKYTIQVAALSARNKAEGVLAKLAADGFSEARIVDNLGDALNRVWVGSFATREDAAAMAERLKGKGYNTYVRTEN